MAVQSKRPRMVRVGFFFQTSRKPSQAMYLGQFSCEAKFEQDRQTDTWATRVCECFSAERERKRANLLFFLTNHPPRRVIKAPGWSGQCSVVVAASTQRIGYQQIKSFSKKYLGSILLILQLHCLADIRVSIHSDGSQSSSAPAKPLLWRGQPDQLGQEAGPEQEEFVGILQGQGDQAVQDPEAGRRCSGLCQCISPSSTVLVVIDASSCLGHCTQTSFIHAVLI